VKRLLISDEKIRPSLELVKTLLEEQERELVERIGKEGEYSKIVKSTNKKEIQRFYEVVRESRNIFHKHNN
jgi:hypothetical protein